MRRIGPCLLLLLFAGPALAQLAPYWITAPGCEFVLEPGAQGAGTFSNTTKSVLAPLGIRYLINEEIEHVHEYYVFDANGDLALSEYTWFESAWSHDELYVSFAEPLLTLDYPLTTGKTWTSEAVYQLSYASLPRTVTLTGTVVGPRTVDTVVGPLAVIEVVLSYASFSWRNDTRTYLLHEQLGDVSGLLSTTGCDAVADEGTSWSSLKATFR